MTSLVKATRKNEPLRDRAYTTIKNTIVAAQLPPNDRLVEMTIAASLGTSRTPVREALQKLEKEGLVLRRPKRGLVVKGVTEEEVADILDLQCMLEGYITRLATSRITKDEIRSLKNLIHRQENCLVDGDVRMFVRLDSEFHDVIHRAAKNTGLYDFVRSLREYMDRYRVLVVVAPHANLHLSIKDHKKIVGSMRTRNAWKTEELMDKHVMRANNFIKKKLRRERSAAHDGQPPFESVQKDTSGRRSIVTKRSTTIPQMSPAF